MLGGRRLDGWRHDVWRELSSCEDAEITDRLLDFVASDRVGYRAMVPITFLGAVFGTGAGCLFLAITGGRLQFVAVALGVAVAAFVFVQGRALDGSTWRLLTAHSEPVPFYQDRPHIYDVVKSLHEACKEKPSIGREWARALASVDQQSAGMPAVPILVERLSSLDWEERFVARYLLVKSGGEAVEPLSWLLSDLSEQMRRTAEWLLQCIGKDTSDRLSRIASGLVCPKCFTRFHGHTLSVSKWVTVTYYGCRGCRRSRDYVSGEVVAVLDRDMREHEIGEGAVRVNWLADKRPIDFDRVEILDADESDVERLAVQVGNDSDEIRRVRCAGAPVIVSASCGLSENTMRILRSQFRTVEVRDERA